MSDAYIDRFRDRAHAGRELARLLLHLRRRSPLVLGLPRGGVPVALEVAEALGGELDIWLVRKIGAPYQPELALGALAEDGEPVIDWERARFLGASEDQIEVLIERERSELRRRMARYRGGRPTPNVTGRTVIVIDDGIATGSTVEAAAASLRAHAPDRLVLAVPVAPEDTLERMRRVFDEVVCPLPARFLWAISLYYDDFRQVTDEEVVRMLGHEEPPAFAEHAPY